MSRLSRLGVLLVLTLLVLVAADSNVAGAWPVLPTRLLADGRDSDRTIAYTRSSARFDATARADGSLTGGTVGGAVGDAAGSPPTGLRSGHAVSAGVQTGVPLVSIRQWTFRRAEASPAMRCVQDPGAGTGTDGTDDACGEHVPVSVYCVNGQASADANVMPVVCYAPLPEQYRLSHATVKCDGVLGPADPMVLPETCRLEYSLARVAVRDRATARLIFVLVAVFVVTFAYNALEERCRDTPFTRVDDDGVLLAMYYDHTTGAMVAGPHAHVGGNGGYTTSSIAGQARSS
jgi:hypothetical protein